MASIDLKKKLKEKEKEYNLSDDIFGMSLLTNTGYVSSARALMFTSHLRQFVNLIEPEFPKVMTGYENMVGKNSTGFYKSPGNIEVIDIVPRFEDGEHDRHLYTMFYYDKDKDMYGLIDKQLVEDLTEKFGYSYVNDNLDSKSVGDKIKKDEVLYHTTSYDKEMNYGFGKNVRVMYTLENHTMEDAIVVSRSFAESTKSKEIETVTVSLNDNDILCNIYGDANEYKCFPDIGEYVKNKIVCAKRRIHNSQILFDLKKSNLRKINMTSDNLFYNSGKLVDIVIYSNKTLDELEDNVFNRQIIKYLKMQTKYYERIYQRCKDIIHSGSKYTNDISFMYRKACDILDDECAWREENSVFSHMIIKFQFERDSTVSVGSKLTGRYGNKGVISVIWEDEDMPYLENGERIDCMINALGVVNRLNPAQSYEVSINFICNYIQAKLRTMTKLKDKENLLFDIIGRFNADECRRLKDYYYNDLDTKGKKQFFEDIDTDGIYIHRPPLWEKEAIFEILRQLYKDYDWIKPLDVYVNRFGRKIKILKPLIIGEMYMMKLKQNSKKGFSARSTGALSKKGVPEKSSKAKYNQELYSTTPIRIGVDENQNLMIGVPPEIVAKLHMYYRSSVIARKALAKGLMSDIEGVKKLKGMDKYTNRNAEILAAYLKALGVRINFLDDKYNINIDAGDYQTFEREDGGMFIGTLSEFEDDCIMQEIKNKYENEECFVGTNEEFDKRVRKEFKVAKISKDKMYIDIDLGEDE